MLSKLAAFAGLTLIAAVSPVEELLASDDECSSGDKQCSLNAVQLNGERRLSVSAFLASQDLHEAVANTLMAVGSKQPLPGGPDAVRAYVSAGFQNAGSGAASEFAAELTWQQRGELLNLVRSLSNLSLHSSWHRRLQRASPVCDVCWIGNGQCAPHSSCDWCCRRTSVYHFQSFDADGPGTGELGSDGRESVSEVTIKQRSSSIWEFKVGPSVSGMYLIKGTMLLTHEGPDGMFGNITAGFVNLRSTLSGSWATERRDLNSTLHIHLNETSFDEEWMWSPRP
eukprot:TRINITY_DN2894_c0_g1_i3.p1 TRINITY_DN2894_c0_g1~~TRINITY_DN2894_c0_g1_i3.p1  ORF type:complete len:283 (-),score=50.75 TRINITY_DN2894_c0_g1_i3:383-1231(-)